MASEVSKELLRSSGPNMLFELHMQLELYAICWALERWGMLVGKIRIKPVKGMNLSGSGVVSS